MSYYSSSASILDPYCAGGRYHGSVLADSPFDRRESYTSTYSSSFNNVGNDYTSTSSALSRRPSAFDRYVSYLSDELSPATRTSARSSTSRPSYSSHLTSSSNLSNLYEDDFKLPALNSSSSYRRISSNSFSSNLRESNGLSSTGRPLITSVPAFDKYGKELSNYERWKLQHGDSGYSSSTTSDSKPARSSRLALNDESSPTPTSSTSTAARVSRVDREPTLSREQKEISPIFTSRSFKSSASGGKSLSYESTPITSSYSRPTSIKSIHSFPSSVRSKLSGYDVQDVRGDGGCYYRCLSLFYTGSEDSYNKYRREVMNYIRDNLDTYSSMIKSEVGYASTNDYFSRKLRTDHQEFAETTEIIATCCLYDINIHVLALVPGRHTWEWLHFDPSIGSGKSSYTSRNIYLYNQGSVHFMLCTPK